MPKTIFRMSLIFISLIIINSFISLEAYGATQKAVIIGIDQYANLPKLQYSTSDAQELSQVLSQNGYECKTLINADATKENITDTFIQLEQLTSQDSELDILLVYFSGRGTRIPDDIQADETVDSLDECILPCDAEANNPRSYIRDDAVALWLTSIKAKQTVVILDCGFWGDDSIPSIKGIGKMPESKSLDGFDIADGLPSDTIILSAGLPDARIDDGVFTGKFMEAFTSEEADKNNDRVISLIEAYQYSLKQLQEQKPQLYDPKNIDVPLASLPQLSKLTVNSEPDGADIQVFSGSTQIYPSDPLKTPAIIPLRLGSYAVKIQKSGFFIPKAQEITISQYNNAYSVEPFKLKPIRIIGQVKINNKSGAPVSLDENFVLLVKQSDSEVYSEALSADYKFMFSLESNQWLQTGVEYEVIIIGKSVLNFNPVRFVYSGYNDMNTELTVTLDDIPPILSQNGIEIQPVILVVGDELTGTIKAQDDGLGLADSVDIQLISSDKKAFSVPASQITYQPPKTYKFHHVLQEDQAGKWNLDGITLRDKANNENYIPGDQMKISFTVFTNRFELGKYYFDSGNYVDALAQFKQYTPQNDDTRYFIALSYYHQADIKKALETFDSIEVKTNYLSDSRSKEIPQMPRPMTNKIWGNLLNNLKTHKKDTAYLNLVASVAEELGRKDAKMYREYAQKGGSDGKK
jgi:hypothetical protein